MLLEQLHSAPHLPRCQTAFELLGRFAKLTISPHEVRTNRHGERVHEQLREHLRPVQTRKHRLSQVVENGVGSSVNTVEAFNLTHSSIVCKGIESGPGNMEMDPVDGPRVSNARIRLKVAHGDAAHWPRPPRATPRSLCIFRRSRVPIPRSSRDSDEPKPHKLFRQEWTRFAPGCRCGRSGG